MSKLELFKQSLASENMDVLTGQAALAIKGGKKSGKKSRKRSKKSKKSRKYNYGCTPPPPTCYCPPPPCGAGYYGNPHYRPC